MAIVEQDFLARDATSLVERVQQSRGDGRGVDLIDVACQVSGGAAGVRPEVLHDLLGLTHAAFSGGAGSPNAGRVVNVTVT